MQSEFHSWAFEASVVTCSASKMMPVLIQQMAGHGLEAVATRCPSAVSTNTWRFCVKVIYRCTNKAKLSWGESCFRACARHSRLEAKWSDEKTVDASDILLVENLSRLSRLPLSIWDFGEGQRSQPGAASLEA